jgi:hypothetical protein
MAVGADQAQFPDFAALAEWIIHNRHKPSGKWQAAVLVGSWELPPAPAVTQRRGRGRPRRIAVAPILQPAEPEKMDPAEHERLAVHLAQAAAKRYPLECNATASQAYRTRRAEKALDKATKDWLLFSRSARPAEYLAVAQRWPVLEFAAIKERRRNELLAGRLGDADRNLDDDEADQPAGASPEGFAAWVATKAGSISPLDDHAATGLTWGVAHCWVRQGLLPHATRHTEREAAIRARPLVRRLLRQLEVAEVDHRQGERRQRLTASEAYALRLDLSPAMQDALQLAGIWPEQANALQLSDWRPQAFIRSYTQLLPAKLSAGPDIDPRLAHLYAECDPGGWDARRISTLNPLGVMRSNHVA